MAEKIVWSLYLREINRFITVGLICCIALELLLPGSVVSVFNLNYWLILWVVSVILVVFNDKP